MSFGDILDTVFGTKEDEFNKIYLRAPVFDSLADDIIYPNILEPEEEYSTDLSGVWIG